MLLPGEGIPISKGNEIMTKEDIVECIQSTTGMQKKESYDMLEAVLSIMKDTLIAGENIKVSKFGVFEVREKKDRKGRNPQTGEPITINARRILTFKPSVILRNGINHEQDKI
jgi:integration host factor subunit alpha